MKWLLLFMLTGPVDSSLRCQAKKFKCDLRCNEDTKGGTLARLRCYERCTENETDCRKYGSDEP